MIFAIPKEDILAQLFMQLKSHFFISEEEQTVIEARYENALGTCEENFTHSENKYYFVEEGGGKNL